MIQKAAFLTGIFLLVATAGAWAQEPPDPSTEVLQEAIAKLNDGKDDEAVIILERLLGLEDPPPIALGLLGALYVEMDRPYDALEVLGSMADADNPDPAVLYNAGRAALATGNIDRAERYLSRSVQLQPESPAVRELGLLRGAQGRYDEALILLGPWADQNPDDVEVRMAAALCALQLERAPDAEKFLSDLPQDQPRVRLLWSRLLILRGDPWGAIGTLEPALENTPPEMEMDVRRALAEAYAAVGQAGKSVEILQQFSGSDPSVSLQLAQSQYQSGDLAGALQTLQPFAEGVLAADMASVPREMGSKITLDYGRFLAMSGRYDDALPYLERTTTLRPEEKQGWQMLGQTLAGLGRRDEAQVALERFQELSKAETSASTLDRQMREELDDPALRSLRQAGELMAEEKTEEALALVQRERAMNPGDIRAALLEGQILMVLDRLDQALALSEQIVVAAPGNADALYLRGTVQMARSELGQAEADFRQALVLAPNHTAAMNDLAVLLLDRGDTGEARLLLQRVLELNPGDAIAASNLESLGTQ